MLRIALCDDEPCQRETVRRFAQSYFDGAETAADGKKETPALITDFSCARDVLSALEAGAVFDIALLDICMPDLDGVSLARAIVKCAPATKIIFLTSSTDYAVDAFAVGAVHYLVKPFTQRQMNDALSRAVASIPENSRKIIITGTRGKTDLVNTDDIITIESVGYTRVVTTKHGPLTEMRRTLHDFLTELNRLSPGQFILPYRGYVINLAAVRTVQPCAIEMTNGTKIPLKRGDYTAVKTALFDYSFVQGGGIE